MEPINTPGGKYQNKYRIPSARAQWWDYAAEGLYFVTVCTADRECLFGEINDDEMILSPMGEIVQDEWDKSFEIRAELSCDVWVIMPNHLHAILRIEGNDQVATVETHGRASLQNGPNEPNSNNSTKTCVAYRAPKSISSFMAGFKSAATTRINEYRIMPAIPVWQARFHDRIIRDEKEYNRIYEYIVNNPANWQQDKFYKE